MTFFRTNNTGMLSRRGAKNVYSEYDYAAPVRVKCAVVSLAKTVAKTSVRTDQSGTRGNAEEFVTQSVVLFPPAVAIQPEDKFEILGMRMRVVGIQPRADILGKLDHNEVSLEHLP